MGYIVGKHDSVGIIEHVLCREQLNLTGNIKKWKWFFGFFLNGTNSNVLAITYFHIFKTNKMKNDLQKKKKLKSQYYWSIYDSQIFHAKQVY